MVSTRDGLLARTVGVGALVETAASRARDPGGCSGTLAEARTAFSRGDSCTQRDD